MLLFSSPSTTDPADARAAAFACVDAVSRAADVLRRAPDRDTFEEWCGSALRGWGAIDQLRLHLVGTDLVSWGGVTAWSYHRIAWELLARVPPALQKAAASVLAPDENRTPAWSEIQDAALPEIQKLAALPYEDLRRRIDTEADRPRDAQPGGRTAARQEEGTGVSRDQDEGQAEALSPLQYDILDALRGLRATDPEKRATGPDIAGKVGGDATGQSVKAPLADLKRRGLVDSRTGRQGGSWLTPKGLTHIKALRPGQ
jgi:hypothetical protein